MSGWRKSQGGPEKQLEAMGHCNYLLAGKILNTYYDKQLNVSNLAIHKHVMMTIK